MKLYFAAEMGTLAALTGALLSLPRLGGPLIVIPIVIIAWVALQLVSGIAFCNAIHGGRITVIPDTEGVKETYALAKSARPGWLVMRHVWMYSLLRDPEANAPASVVKK